jgi:coenzyme Q-binding protein COQ10|tara:strand:+ start:508 stop:936 length:429 start_codon:yes stop_codon:yes gene_type:complete
LIDISYKKTLNYSPKNIYEIVSNVDFYSQFIPGCVSSEIISREGNVIEAILELKYLVMSGKFKSRVTLDPKKLTIISEGIEGPFSSILTKWSFNEVDEGVLVNINIALDLNNKIFESILKKNIKKIISKVVVSFEERADILY